MRCISRLLTDQDAVRRRRRLQPRRSVDNVARDDSLSSLGLCAERDDRLARVDGEPYLQVECRIGFVHLRDRGAYGQSCPHGTLGIVAVRDRRAEDRHDRVADELLDRSSERFDLGSQTRVVRTEDRTNVFGIELLGPSGEPDEVDEQDGDDLSLLAPFRRGAVQRASAGVAKPGLLRVCLSTRGAHGHA